MAGVYRQPISSLRPDAQNTLVIGVIINSKNPRNFNYQDKSTQHFITTVIFFLFSIIADNFLLF